MAMKEEERLELFLKIGLDERLVSQRDVIEQLEIFLYTVATKVTSKCPHSSPCFCSDILSPQRIKTPAQLEAAFSFLSSTASESFELKGFEEACGVRVEVSEEDIERTVNEVFEQNKGLILELRYRTNVLGFPHHHDNVGLSPGLILLLIWAIREWKLKLALVYTVTRWEILFGHVRKRLPWADPKIGQGVYHTVVESTLNSLMQKFYELLGGRTAADNEKPSKQKKERPAKVHTEIFFSDRPVLQCCNTKEVLDKHLKRTSRKVYTRFPPEPNGYLHIGHAKAMFVSFGLAKERGLDAATLGYDDTNLKLKRTTYIDHIRRGSVEWMGCENHSMITYTSDYFQELYELAVVLIQRHGRDQGV
ncbi:hypothetical protein NC652_027043 [Populus alba x Populus x berolinensis]|nr:hypothetical protein NC652_027043 [Populus alba x Populus x berolinensis]